MPGLEHLSSDDKFNLYRNSFMGFHVLDIAFMSLQIALADEDALVFTDGTRYTLDGKSVGFTRPDDAEDIQRAKTFTQLNRRLLDVLIRPMAAINLDHVEYAALKALLFCRHSHGLSPAGKAVTRDIEVKLIRGLNEYYQGMDSAERIGQIFLLKVNAIELRRAIFEAYRMHQ
ncbi:CRE-NHR-20 protein, partial [Aphelenchoides avenae]